MVKIRILLLSLIFFLNLSGAENGESNPGKAIPITRFLPGVQQLLSKKTVKGSILLGAFLGTIAGAIIENDRGNRYYERYLDSTEVDEIIRLRKETEKSFRNRNYYMLGICAVWLIHALDMKIFKTSKGVIKGEASDHSFCVGFFYFF